MLDHEKLDVYQLAAEIRRPRPQTRRRGEGRRRVNPSINRLEVHFAGLSRQTLYGDAVLSEHFECT